MYSRTLSRFTVTSSSSVTAILRHIPSFGNHINEVMRELDISDIAPRIREHRARERKLQDSAREVEATLAERRVRLDNLETITTFAQDMSTSLDGSGLTERKAFIQSFVKEISVGPGKATIRYNIPMPEDGGLRGKDTGELTLPSPVRYTVRPGTLPVLELSVISV